MPRPWDSPSSKPLHTTRSVGLVLAESGVDLGSAEACIDMLVSKEIAPWQCERGFNLLDARIEAHNWRTMQRLIKRAKVADVPYPTALVGEAPSSLASEAEPAMRVPSRPLAGAAVTTLETFETTSPVDSPVASAEKPE